MQSIVVFASGAGSNARAIIRYFNATGKAKVSLIVTNNAAAPVLDVAREYGIPFLIIDKTTLSGPLLIEQLKEYKPSLIALAGFLWKLPSSLINAFNGKIVNIHPALLPKYGGKGMYGIHIHRAVLQANEIETGITIHHVNEHYDEGGIILQMKCPVYSSDTPESLSERIRDIEHYFYPRILEYLLEKQ